jgi:hypothetical protein
MYTHKYKALMFESDKEEVMLDYVVCICMYICVNMYTHKYKALMFQSDKEKSRAMRVHVCMCRYVCMYVCIYIYIYIYIYVCIYIRTRC